MKSRTGDYEPMNPEALMAGETKKMMVNLASVTIAQAAAGEAKFPRPRTRSDKNPSVIAHVSIRMEPGGKGTGVFVLSEITDGSIPPKLLAAVRQGILDGLKVGPVTHGPVTDLTVAIVACAIKKEPSATPPDSDISFIAYTSSMPKISRPAGNKFPDVPELALGIAGTCAVWEALKKAGTAPIK